MDNHTEQMIKKVEGGRIKRLLFQNVPYDDFEMEKIQQLKKFLKKQGIKSYDDVLMLKFLYLSGFDFKQCIRRINIYEQWMHNPLIQGKNKKAEYILRQGTLYSYGRDRQLRPILIFKVFQISLEKYSISDYYWALKKLMTPIQQAMLVPGKIQKITVILDIGSKNLLIPLISDHRKIISKIATAYMHRVDKIIMINSSFMANFMYKTNKKQLQQQTSKIIVTSSNDQLKKYISPEQLQQKHGGNKSNLIKFWPIQTPNNDIMLKRRKIKQIFGEQESSFESIDSDQTRFIDSNIKPHHNDCCCECSLF